MDNELVANAHQAVGMLRAAIRTLEACDPNSTEARKFWQEGMVLVQKALNRQWDFAVDSQSIKTGNDNG